MVPMDSEHVYITDVLSYNHYFGWYMGEVAENGPWMDAFHKMNPARAVGISGIRRRGHPVLAFRQAGKPRLHRGIPGPLPP